jgi:hypothetical protein
MLLADALDPLVTIDQLYPGIEFWRLQFIQRVFQARPDLFQVGLQ